MGRHSAGGPKWRRRGWSEMKSGGDRGELVKKGMK